MLFYSYTGNLSKARPSCEGPPPLSSLLLTFILPSVVQMLGLTVGWKSHEPTALQIYGGVRVHGEDIRAHLDINIQNAALS